MKVHLNRYSSSTDIDQLLERLFPIHRTLVNEGFLKSLNIIQEKIPLSIKEFASGKKVFDWVIPNSWNVRAAYIEDEKGNKLIDFSENNLHLSAYSHSVDGEFTYEELKSHLNWREDLPEAIPYNFHYYKNDWSFNVSFNQLREKFKSETYKVKIDVDEYPDYLRTGEFYLPGALKEEILITTYMCHPSMVNDNLSGVVVAVELFKYLEKINNRRYSYRLLIVPETIGAITYLAHNREQLSKVKAGFTMYCCGDKGNLHYKQSYNGDSYTDKLFEYLFIKYFKFEKESILKFWPGGSDERQFNGAGIRLPMGAITRTPAAEFKEYHTSLDNLDLIRTEDLMDSLEKLLTVVSAIECDILYKNEYFGEPCFSRHNIEYPSFQDALNKSSAYHVKILANEIDGTNSLLDIAKKWDIDIFHLYEIAQAFEKERLITRINE